MCVQTHSPCRILPKLSNSRPSRLMTSARWRAEDSRRYSAASRMRWIPCMQSPASRKNATPTISRTCRLHMALVQRQMDQNRGYNGATMEWRHSGGFYSGT